LPVGAAIDFVAAASALALQKPGRTSTCSGHVGLVAPNQAPLAYTVNRSRRTATASSGGTPIRREPGASASLALPEPRQHRHRDLCAWRQRQPGALAAERQPPGERHPRHAPLRLGLGNTVNSACGGCAVFAP